MVRLLGPFPLVVVALLVVVASPAAGLSHQAADGGTVTWTFVSPLAQPFDEGIELTCLTHTDLRDDPVAVHDPLGEYVRLSCESGIGTYCDHPSWTPEPLREDRFCGDASDLTPCEGVLYNFTGTLRIEPTSGGAFTVTYDGTYDDWDGC